MTHRADQIIDAVVAALEANASLGATVYPHRALSLSDDESELPAIGVTYGEDRAGEVALGGIVYSEMDVQLTAVAVGATEAAVRTALLEIRAQSHIAMMTSTSLGLSFVHGTFYGGATAPELDVGEQIIGALVSTWRVRYEMPYNDPR